MQSTVLTRTYKEIEYDTSEILRYAGCKGEAASEEMKQLVQECIDECEEADAFSYKVAYRFMSVCFSGEGGENVDAAGDVVEETAGDVSNRAGAIDFGLMKVCSNDLTKNLKGCTGCIFMAATIGYGIDRLIAKYSRLDSAKALFMQAIGAQKVESLCDAFCRDIKQNEGYKIRPRFSPGYGDLSLEIQREFLSIVEGDKRLGITLGQGLLMSPSKSVTAIIGID